MVQGPLYSLNASQALSLLKNNTITVEEYARALLGRIKKRDSIVNAWAYLNPEFVLQQARVLDQIPHNQRGPLHGLAIGIKDVMNTKDMPTQFGSPLYQGHQPGFDASIVGILRVAGALIFGKTMTTEFAVTNAGPNTTNPHDPNRTPGGSSCGSAAAVADLQVPLSLGAQTGGSVIRPAAYTGVFATKPTWNAISSEGTKALSVTFDTLGFFARSIEDLQLVADVLAIKDDEPPKDISLKDASVALVKTPMWPQAGPSTEAAMENATHILQANGVRVEEIELPAEIGDSKALEQIQRMIMQREAQVAFLREYRVDKTKIAPAIRNIVENSSNVTHKAQIHAEDQLSSIRAIIDELAANYSAIITPSAMDEAPLGLDDMGSPVFNTLWTGFHGPVITVPAFVGTQGMPIGISLVTGRYRNQRLLRISKILSEPLMDKGGWKAKI